MPPDPADSLYEALPAEFVAARNALVKSLRAQGQRAEADRVSKMARPTASVWASNQVARHASDLVSRLADVTARLKGGIQRDRDRYAAAINEHRELLNQLRERTEKVLADRGLRVAPPVIAAAVQNFRAGLSDEAVRPALEGGRLEHDVGLEAAGALFGMTAVDVPSAPAAAAPPPPPVAPPADRSTGDGERERREHERALAKARAEAERRVTALRKSVETAARARATHEAAVDHARRQLETAEHALAAAQAAEREAAAASAAAESELKKLRDDPA
jgi:hypothetical protein